MKGICLDTSTYSEFMRGDEATIALMEAADQKWLPLVVPGELRAGFLKGSRAAVNEAELAEFLASPYVAITGAADTTSRIYAKVFNALLRRGTPIPANDLWVAACALEQRAALATFDTLFSAIEGLKVVRTPDDPG